MIEFNESRLLTSDSLADRIPDFEPQQHKEESFFVSTLAIDVEGSIQLLSGRSIGTVFEDDSVKVDVRLELQSGIDLFKLHSRGELRCTSVYLSLDDEIIEKQGPFEVIGLRTCDIDPKTKMCTIGVDLKKTTERTK